MKNIKKGFTLIEILVVIGIIAILAAIVLIAINPARQFAQANNSQRTSNVNAILNAIGQYMADNQGDLPDAIDGTLQELSSGSGEADLCDDDIVPTYLSALPVDPDQDVSSPDDEAIDDDYCDAGTAYDTGYTVDVEDGRVTVCAPEAANEDALDDAAAICVTR